MNHTQATRSVDNFIDESINLDGVYSQCNEHLREQDRKRDQLIGVYGALLGLLLTNLDKIANIPFIHVLYVFFIFASWLLADVLINYLKWHTIYVNSAITLQNLMFFKQTNISQQMVNDLYAKTIQRGHLPLKSFLQKTEAKILNLYLLLSCINHYVLIYLYTAAHPNLSEQTKCLLISGATFISILYICIINSRAREQLNELFGEKNYKYPPSWCINLYQHEELLKSGIKKDL